MGPRDEPPVAAPGHVLAANNDWMAAARADWLAGYGPGSHVWGMPALEEAGHRVTYLPADLSSFRRRLSVRAGHRLGDLTPELHALRERRRESVLYAAAPGTFTGLATLRSLGCFANPIVTLVHPAAFRGRGLDRAMRSYDEVIALSRIVQHELVAEAGRPESRTHLLSWGPDLDFPGYYSTGDDAVVCSGKTRRDPETLLRALASSPQSARVHTNRRLDPPPRAEVIVNAPYPQVLADLRAASVVAIPLTTERGLAGITELNDALALGKPVVMTRTPFIDIDIEDVGCGIWVDPGDVAGWASALERLRKDPSLRAEMGRRGRAYAESHHNARLFGQGVRRVVEGVMGRS